MGSAARLLRWCDQGFLAVVEPSHRFADGSSCCKCIIRVSRRHPVTGMPMNRCLIFLAAIVVLLPLAPAFAQRSDADEPEQGRPDTDETIVVTGVRGATADVLGSVSVLDDDELTHDMKPSLGDTLADLPGVSASSFGPSASRPILRGEQGERVRILVDGIGSLDLSSTDPDHAVTINPLTATRIEVLRGPGALLFGSSAIGGVINVVDTRIPRSIPDKPIAVDALLNYGTAANERSANLGIDVPLGGHFVAHVDGAYDHYDDLHIGRYVLSRRLRKEALASADPEIRALADLEGTLPNTQGRTGDLAAGLAY